MEIAGVIAHAIDFQLSPFLSLSDQQVKELEAILVMKVQADLAVLAVQEVPEVHEV